MTTQKLSHDDLWPRAGNWNKPDLKTGADMMLVGVPTWRTSLSPTNAGVTPDAIRAAIARYSEHSVQAGAASSARALQTLLSDELIIADAGNIQEPDLDEESTIKQIAALMSVSKLVLGLGGDNSLTYSVALGAYGADLETAGLITLDAHHDLRDGRSNGSPVRRLIEAGLDPKRIVQIGIADFANSKAYRDRANDLGITVVHRNDLFTRNMADVMSEALKIAGSAGGPVHVDLDVDVCDRSVVPACPASIPGGISASSLRLAARVAGVHPSVKSIDIAEIDAEADSVDGRTVRLGALLVLEAATGLAERLR